MVWSCKDLSNSDDTKAYIWIFASHAEAVEMFRKHKRSQRDPLLVLTKLSTPNKFQKMPRGYELVTSTSEGDYYIKQLTPNQRKRR